MRYCVFCFGEVRPSAICCPRCKEYKGIVEGYLCPICLEPTGENDPCSCSEGLTDKQAREVLAMTSNELVAFWNIIQFSKRAGNSHAAEKLVHSELTIRSIPHEFGKLVTIKHNPLMKYAQKKVTHGS